MPISELLLFFAFIVAAISLFNFLMRQLANKARQARLEKQAAETMAPVQRSTDERDYGWGRTPSAPPLEEEPVEARVTASRSSPAPSGASSTPLHPAVHGLLRGSQNVHDAIVLMTVLGPCRALEPPDDRPQ